MASLSRLKQDSHKVRHFSNQIRRYYYGNSHRTFSHSLIPVTHHPRLESVNSYSFVSNVRFYAAPAKFLVPKKEEKEAGNRLNEAIQAQYVRLIQDKNHCIIPKHEALARAREAGMDLVEVDRNAKPPACKIYDYKKELINQKQREKEQKQKIRSKGLKSGSSKEIRFAGKISDHDLQMKADAVKRLVEKGHRVKCTAVEPTEAMGLKKLLSRFSALIEEFAIMENEPQEEKKQAFVVVRHVKFGGPKTSGKKAPKSKPEDEQLKEDRDAVGNDPEIKDISDSEDHSNSEWTKNTERVIEFEQANAGPSSAPAQGVVNRYAKVQTNVPQMPRPGMNPSPQLPDQRNEPHFNPNSSSQMRQTPRFEVPSPQPPFQQNQPQSNTIPSPPHMNPSPQLPHQRNQPHFNPNFSSQMRQTPRFEVPSPQPPFQQNQPQSNTNPSPPHMNPSPQLPHQQNQPPINPNSSSQRRQTPSFEFPSPQPPFQQNQPQSNTNPSPPHMRPMRGGDPAFGIQRQDPSGNPGSPTKTFGIFSPQPKDTQSNGQGAPAVINRYRKANPPGPGRSPSIPGTNRGPGFDPNAYTNRNEEQPDFRRR